jgi:predicted aldo/keto reductase-like oxidoreductase
MNNGPQKRNQRRSADYLTSNIEYPELRIARRYGKRMSWKMSEEVKNILPSEMNRREFIKTSAMGMLGAQAIFGNIGSQSGKVEQAASLSHGNAPRKIRRGDMYYRRLGRTGLMISEISLGGSPVPPEPVFRKAVEMGVNYVDTSSSYSSGNSERTIGKIIEGRRGKFHVATKFHPVTRRKTRTKEELIEQAEGSLTRLNTDYVDILLIHGASNPDVVTNEEVLAAFDQLKKDGKIRFTGVSCHSDPVGVLTPAVQSGNYDMIDVAYNAYSGTQVEKGKVYDDYLTRSGIEKVIALAKEHDVGVVAMKSMAGGDRQNLAAFKTEGVSIPQAKLKWVLQNDAVAAVITEMVNFDFLNENLAASGLEMSSAERKVLSEYVKATSGDYCRMCGTCLLHCPSEIAIPDIMRYAMYHDGYGKTDVARTEYRRLSAANTFLGCNLCRRCEAACPYGLQIVRKLRRAHQMLA